MAETAKQKTPSVETKTAAEPQTTEPAITESKAEPLAKAPPISMARFGLDSEYNQLWRITVPDGTLPEQTLEQGFWANVSMHFNPGDTVTVKPDDGSWKQILEVIGCGKLYAHVLQLELYDLMPVGAIVELPSIYKIEFAGAHHKWRVLREGSNLRDNFRTKSEAAKWAANHEAAVNR